jgi:hypothetical protein
MNTKSRTVCATGAALPAKKLLLPFNNGRSSTLEVDLYLLKKQTDKVERSFGGHGMRPVSYKDRPSRAYLSSTGFQDRLLSWRATTGFKRVRSAQIV